MLVTAIRSEFPQYAPLFLDRGHQRSARRRSRTTIMLIGRYRRRRRHEDRLRLRLGLQHDRLGDARRHDAGGVVLGENLAVSRTEAAAELLEQGFDAPGCRARRRSPRCQPTALTRRGASRYARRGLLQEEARQMRSREMPPAADAGQGRREDRPTWRRSTIPDAGRRSASAAPPARSRRRCATRRRRNMPTCRSRRRRPPTIAAGRPRLRPQLADRQGANYGRPAN